jgi:hypothetical protein
MIRSVARGLLRLRSSAPPPRRSSAPPPRQYTAEEKLKLQNSLKLRIKLRKTQLKEHADTFQKILIFYEFLEKFITEFRTFISEHYEYENKDHILETIPISASEIDEIDISYYDSYAEGLHDIEENLTDPNIQLNIIAIRDIQDGCIQANNKWHEKYNYYFLQFREKKKYIETMFAELKKNIKKPELATSITDKLLRELIHTKKYVDELLYMYVSTYRLSQIQRKNGQNIPEFPEFYFDFELFEEVLLNIIKKLEPDQPTRHIMYHSEGSRSKTPFNGYNTSGIEYIGPASMQTREEQKPLFTEFPPDYMGGIKRHNSKLYTYKYYNKAFNINSKKTFQKKRNYKKTKRRKH